MSTLNGLPAHVLLVHGIVVLVPLTAVLLMVSAVWPAARRRLIWLAAVLAVVVTVLTPLTTEAGEWLEHRLGESPAIEKHADLGDQMLYYVVPLLITALLLLAVQVLEGRGKPVGRAALAVVAVLVVAAGAAATVQTYRVGDSGSQAVWGGVGS
ncbi:DUF2231 domain-containing protein [Nocardia yamanashiensis]|uniref:DUF2231 domain-containing protein n=1 Tax=Nocardia yamanashiensis TaxID=209247 RepID=UPI000829B763|nr:DUF2231 domain-containing protein [Nocardia yamanashiensis]